MTLLEQLKVVATSYAAARDLSLSRVSTLVFGDGMKLGAVIERNADMTTARFEASMEWFSANWPENTPWPEGIERPFVKAGADAA